VLAVDTAVTTALDTAALDELRRFLHDAYDGTFGDRDWEHALGGVHALGTEAGALVAHASVVRRTLVHDGRPLRTGYVEAVAVRGDRRRRGYGRAVMEAIGDVLAETYELGALSGGGGAARLYRSLGWRPWAGRTWVDGPNGLERTPADDDGVHVLPLAAELDFTGDLVCDWRDGDVW
jgi:aminoglycoside 2'-N-acetyltransferase I